MHNMIRYKDTRVFHEQQEIINVFPTNWIQSKKKKYLFYQLGCSKLDYVDIHRAQNDVKLSVFLIDN